MTATDLGGGPPDKFLGAYVKNISSNLGLSTSPSTSSITVIEDDGVNFTFPNVGTFHTITAGTDWEFSGVLTRYEIDIANISGRAIRISLSDPREIMKSIPVILAPGSEAIVDTINTGTGCSILDVYGAYGQGLVNLSNWNQAGMPFKRIVSALKGDNITFGTATIPIFQQSANVFGEQYVFDLSEVATKVDGDHRINTNLNPLSNLIEDLSQRHSFDWFVDSERRSDGVIQVTIRIIDRSVDNIDIGLQSFLDLHDEKVITATSGVELRNEVSCMALQGAAVESLKKVEILGMANEPIDLVMESGINNYFMEEDEMLAALAGRLQWEQWLGNQAADSLQGLSRYGPNWSDDDLGAIMELTGKMQSEDKNNEGKVLTMNDKRIAFLLDAVIEKRNAMGRLYTKLHDHAAATYGKRFVHDSILDEIIQSAWTRGVVAGNDDPNEYFRQDDGRTKAYVEFSNEDAGGAFSLGLNDLTNLFGDQDIFKNVTRFGNTFSNRALGQEAVLVLELANNFSITNSLVDIKDTSNYVYKEATAIVPNVKTALYVSCTVNKDGTVTLPGVVMEENSPEKKLAADAKTIANKLERPVEEIQKRLIRFYGGAFWGVHVKSYQPSFVYIPTRSRTLRYGPVFSSNLGADAQGKVQIIQDDGFAPWEFGSISTMIAAMQIKVDNATSLQKEAFSANISVEGFPLFKIGDSLEKNSNINSISMSFGDSGVRTTYGLQTYTRKFGEISKEDLARIAFMLNNGGGRVLSQQQSNFLSSYNINVDKGLGTSFGVSNNNVNGGAGDFG